MSSSNPTNTLKAPSQPITAIKARLSMKPPAVKAAIIAKRANGEDTTKIAKDLGITRNTTRKIIAESNIDRLIESAEVGAAHLIHKSINVLDQRLDKCSESAATFILSNTVFSDRYSKQGKAIAGDTVVQLAINNLINVPQNNLEKAEETPQLRDNGANKL